MTIIAAGVAGVVEDRGTKKDSVQQQNFVAIKWIREIFVAAVEESSP